MIIRFMYYIQFFFLGIMCVAGELNGDFEGFFFWLCVSRRDYNNSNPIETGTIKSFEVGFVRTKKRERIKKYLYVIIIGPKR